MRSSQLTTVVGTLAVASYCSAFTATVPSPRFATHRSAMTMRKGGRRSRDLLGDAGSRSVGSKGVTSMGGAGAAPQTSTNWVPVASVKSMADLPQEEGKVLLVDTMAQQLIDGAVNPNGAVGVVKFKGSTHCIASSCPSCRIPLAKAKVLDPTEETGTDPRICCDFCSATFNIRSGQRIADAGGSGLFGGIAKSIMNAQDSRNGVLPLETYELGEKKGSVFINLP